MRRRKQVGNTFIVGKPHTSDTEPDVVEETIPIKKQPGYENYLESSTRIAGKLEIIKTQASPPNEVFVTNQIVHSNRRISKTVISDIGDLLSERHALEKSKNRTILLSILSNIRYLARQALPLRGGDWNTETKCEENSNFHQLLKLWAQENPEITEGFGKEPEKYTSPEI